MLMESPDGIERRGDRPLLPTAEKRRVFTGEGDSSVDLAQVVVMFGTRIGSPHPKATHRKRRTMPGHGHTVLELLVVLRMDLAAVIDDSLYTLRRRHRRKFHGSQAPNVGAQQHAFAAALKAGVWVADIHDRQIGVGDTAEDFFVFLPEAALELQSCLDSRGVGDR